MFDFFWSTFLKHWFKMLDATAQINIQTNKWDGLKISFRCPRKEAGKLGSSVLSQRRKSQCIIQLLQTAFDVCSRIPFRSLPSLVWWVCSWMRIPQIVLVLASLFNGMEMFAGSKVLLYDDKIRAQEQTQLPSPPVFYLHHFKFQISACVWAREQFSHCVLLQA